MQQTVTTIDPDDQAKLKLLNKSELDEVDRAFSLNALRVLESRYLLKDEAGQVIESPKQLFTRIATLVGLADALHDKYVFSKDPISDSDKEYEVADNVKTVADCNDILAILTAPLCIGDYELNEYHVEALVRFYLTNISKMKMPFYDLIEYIECEGLDDYAENIKQYYDLMVSKDFMPNTPTIMNAGARLGQLSACFVLGIEDNIESIMETAKDTAFIFKSGGGVGINYSDLRPEGSLVGSTSGVASGPVSFMGIVDKITDVIKQGGKRRGANMGILEVGHPDVEKFITAKKTKGVLENFNVSVGIWRDFWDAYEKGQLYEATNGKLISPTHLLDLIANSAWASAEPGVIFLDSVNKHNPLLKARGYPLRATNPCGEQSLYPYESCNLGSINLANFVGADGTFNMDRFTDTVRLCTQFLDNIIDMNKYPMPKIANASFETRRIGVGIMGLSDALIKMGIGYNSFEGYEFMDQVAETLTYSSMDKSVELAEERGSFGLFEESGYKEGLIPVAGAYDGNGMLGWDVLIEKIKAKGIRNSFCTTVAPTGSLSMIADTSSGIEPTFALAFEKKVAVGNFLYKNEYLEGDLDMVDLDTPEIWQKIKENKGSVQKIDEIPNRIKRVFVTSHDLSWEDHVKAQAVWQKWINNAISKTINLPKSATVDEIKAAYLKAHELGLKGITVFRDGSRGGEQVLNS